MPYQHFSTAVCAWCLKGEARPLVEDPPGFNQLDPMLTSDPFSNIAQEQQGTMDRVGTPKSIFKALVKRVIEAVAPKPKPKISTQIAKQKKREPLFPEEGK